MVNNPLISIVIPVYNVEKYLEKCLKSVLSQNFTDYEIILVNDGSKDNSLKICNSFVQLDDRIKLIEKENGGLSDARNFGINHSTGKYIIFLDSDDYWREKTALNLVVEKLAKTYDVVLFKYQEYNVVQDKIIQKQTIPFNIDNLNDDKNLIIKKLFEDHNFPGSAWRLLINRKFLLANNLYFQKGIKSEDIDWLINVFINLKTITGVDDDFYIYLKNRPGSITNTANYKSFLDLFYSIDKWRPVLESIKENYSKSLLAFLSYEYIIALMNYSKLNKLDKIEAKKYLKNQKSILKYSKGLKNKFCEMLILFLGFDISSYLILKMYRFLSNN
jgi:glycosyltransferase involved in cell wall biosynthesis